MLESKCPSCGKLMSEAEASGPAATCSSCGGAFAAGAPPERRGASRFEDDDLLTFIGWSKWRTTHNGLQLIFWGVLAIFLFTEALSATMVVASDDLDAPPRMSPAMIVFTTFGCLSAIADLAAFVGMCMCCTVPDRKARKWAIRGITSLVLGVIAVALFVGAFVIVMVQAERNRGAVNGPDLDLFSSWMGIGIGAILSAFMLAFAVSWILFHAAAASALKVPSLRRLAMIVLTVWLIYSPLSFATSMLGSQSWVRFHPAELAKVQAAISLVLNAIAYVAYLVLCRRTIVAIRKVSRDADLV